MIISKEGITLTPGKSGKDCVGYSRCCDECDYIMCCIAEFDISDCNCCLDGLCPRSACFDKSKITFLLAILKKILLRLNYGINRIKTKLKGK